MPGERYDTPVNPHAALDDLDRELRAALALTPSADFEARVLDRIARRVSRPQWWKDYVPLAAAAALVIVTSIAAAIVYLVPQDSLDVPDVAAPSFGVLRPPAPPSPVVLSPFAPRPVAHRRRQLGSGVTASSGAAAEPEVIVPPDQANAIRRLVRALSDGSLPPESLPEQPAAGAPDPLAVRRLTVAPIPVASAEPQEREAPVVRPQ
jgi:hypothetical protein